MPRVYLIKPYQLRGGEDAWVIARMKVNDYSN